MVRDLIKRFQINYVDGEIVSVTDELKHDTLNILRMVSLLNKQQEEINLLQDRIDELEDDNEKYSLGCEDIILENPQFKVTSCPTEIKDTSNNHYYWLEHEGNVKALCQVINEIINENSELKELIKIHHIKHEGKKISSWDDVDYWRDEAFKYSFEVLGLKNTIYRLKNEIVRLEKELSNINEGKLNMDNAKIEQIIQDLMYEYNSNYESQLEYFDKSFNKARTLKNMRYWEAGINVLIHLLTRLKEENILQDD